MTYRRRRTRANPPASPAAASRPTVAGSGTVTTDICSGAVVDDAQVVP